MLGFACSLRASKPVALLAYIVHVSASVSACLLQRCAVRAFEGEYQAVCLAVKAPRFLCV